MKKPEPQESEGTEFNLDCGDNSCYFATKREGLRTNGGCRCLENDPRGVERYARKAKQQAGRDRQRIEELVEWQTVERDQNRRLANRNADLSDELARSKAECERLRKNLEFIKQQLRKSLEFINRQVTK